MRRFTLLSMLLLAACGPGDRAPSDRSLDVVTDTVGDTVVVRTVAGSAWGEPATLAPEVSIGELEGDLEYLLGSVRSLAVGPDGTIYIVDRQGPELRAYDRDGGYVATLAGPGEGPGELRQPDAGLAVLSDGRIVVRDPGNARIQVLSPEGDPLDEWPIRGGFFNGSPLPVDREDHVYVSTVLNPEDDFTDWQSGLVRVAPDGTPSDTIIPPDAGFDAPRLEARRVQDGNSAVSVATVPFSASERVAFHPDGFFLHGVSTRYRIDLLRPEGTLRIERAVDPVPVTAGEREENEERVTRSMRNTQPDWSWSGPPIPDVKPAYGPIYVGRGGRIWVQATLPGYERDDPDYDPTDPRSVERRWTTHVAFDVFEGDGAYLGRVHAPDDFLTYPTAVVDGDRVWAVTRDELGVERVVRFRIQRPSET